MKNRPLGSVQGLLGMCLLFAACHTTPPAEPEVSGVSGRSTSSLSNFGISESAAPVSLPASREQPIWSKSAVPLRSRMEVGAIPSPDGRITIKVGLQPGGGLDRNLLLHVTMPTHTENIKLDEGANELLWSPDSRAFMVNGGFNRYSGFFVAVYSIRDEHIDRLDVTEQAQRDMVASFPPCKAANRDDGICKETTEHPDFNMSGLDWIKGSTAIVVFAEVPPTSSYGGILGQVLGYELEIPTGKILQRMQVKEFKRVWQPSAAWDIHVPDAPAYGPPYNP